jgi:hypothetical protein
MLLPFFGDKEVFASILLNFNVVLLPLGVPEFGTILLFCSLEEDGAIFANFCCQKL